MLDLPFRLPHGVSGHFRSISPYLSIPIAFLFYSILCKALRNRRTKKLRKALGYDASLTTAEVYEKITLDDAQKIMLNMSLWEFPRFFEVALQFALFRTYAIPTISAILTKTRQLSDEKPVPKRYVDTVILIAEFVRFPLDSERASLAIARMNYLHAQHTSILPRDTLYTLLLFATQPIDFITRYEWRTPSPLERAAMWKYWSEVGRRMGIPYETIPPTLEKMFELLEQYEEEYMVPAESNNVVGNRTVELLLYWVPEGPMKRFGKQCVYGILDKRLHTAMQFPQPHFLVPHFLSVVLATRKFYLRHFSLPRFFPVEKLIKTPNPKTGLWNAHVYDVEPWYAPVTFWNQWGPWALIAWAGGWPVIEEGRFASGGYDIVEVGPKRFVGKGKERVVAEAEKIRAMGAGRREGEGRGGCPFG